MTRRYVVRYVKHTYKEIIVEADSIDNARVKSQAELTDPVVTSQDNPALKVGKWWTDMICRINDKGKRANVPFDDDDEEIEEVDEREWNCGA